VASDVQEQQSPNHDLPRRPKSGFAREKLKRLAAEERANTAEAKLRELGAMDDRIETQEPQMPNRKSSGYRRLQGRHQDLIKLYEILMKDHEALTAKHEELQADAQRLLVQHRRLMQAVQSGPQRAGVYP
jgi:hypothetical protein